MEARDTENPMAFRISITADFYDECGEPKYSDFGLSVFEGHDSIDVAAFSQHNVEIGAEQLADAHAVLVLTEWEEYKNINWDNVIKKMVKPAWVSIQGL